VALTLGHEALCLGRLDDATCCFAAALPGQVESYVPIRQLAGVFEGLSYVSARQGSADRAALLLASADRWRRETVPLYPVWAAEHDRTVSIVRHVLGPRFDELWAQGATMTIHEATSLVVAMLKATPAGHGLPESGR
jgi:hypothetical protein